LCYCKIDEHIPDRSLYLVCYRYTSTDFSKQPIRNHWEVAGGGKQIALRLIPRLPDEAHQELDSTKKNRRRRRRRKESIVVDLQIRFLPDRSISKTGWILENPSPTLVRCQSPD
jgi:hypothetical protein